MKISTKITTSGPLMTGQAKPNLRGLVAGIESTVVGHILERTARGVDINDRAFKPYHPDYSLIRRLTGRSPSPVQLIWSGKMMNAVAALSTLIDRTRFAVAFGVKPRDDRNLIASYLQRARKWFGLSTSGRKELGEWIAANIKRALYGLPMVRPPRKPRPPVEREEAKAVKTNYKAEARAEVRARRERGAAARANSRR